MAAAKEITVEDQLKNLYKLQQIHSEIDQIQTLKGELPMEVQDLEDEIAGLETRVSKLKSEEDGLKDQIGKLKTTKKEAEALVNKYEKQQNNVKNNREYDALTKEIELQNLEMQLCDKKVRDADVEIEMKMAYTEESSKSVEEKKNNLVAKKVELEKIIGETDEKEKKLGNKAKRAAKDIEDRLITAFNRIRTTYNNRLGVAIIERDSCGGCFAVIPPQRQLEIKQRKKVIVCEHCGRILIDPNIENPSEVN